MAAGEKLMPIPSEREIRTFLNEHIRLWNACDRDGFTALYEKYAPNGLIIEYVGVPIGDGWAAFNHMWDTYNGKVRVDIDTILVNGNEGACHYDNVDKATEQGSPSLEVYRFGDGKMHIRYFHHSDALVD
jgi:hypothetical protein